MKYYLYGNLGSFCYIECSTKITETFTQSCQWQNFQSVTLPFLFFFDFTGVISSSSSSSTAKLSIFFSSIKSSSSSLLPSPVIQDLSFFFLSFFLARLIQKRSVTHLNLGQVIFNKMLVCLKCKVSVWRHEWKSGGAIRKVIPTKYNVGDIP